MIPRMQMQIIVEQKNNKKIHDFLRNPRHQFESVRLATCQNPDFTRSSKIIIAYYSLFELCSFASISIVRMLYWYQVSSLAIYIYSLIYYSHIHIHSFETK